MKGLSKWGNSPHFSLFRGFLDVVRNVFFSRIARWREQGILGALLVAAESMDRWLNDIS
jgi:hypothetical protein